MRVEKDFKKFIELLNKNKVNFIEVSEENSINVMKILEDFGFGESGLKGENFQKTGQIIQLGNAPLRIDIITSLTGIKFKNA